MSTTVAVVRKNQTPRVSVTTQKNKKVAVVKQSAPVVVKSKAEPKVKVVAEPKVDEESSENTTKIHVDAKKRRRPRLRQFDDIFAQTQENINTAYKCLLVATRSMKSLQSAHNREVHNTKNRTNTHRTPTIVFDQELVDYFTSRLDASELTVNRKEGETETVVDLSGLDTNTRVHRTDVTQLYNKTFKKHNMLNSEDRRYILYKNDPELVHLLTSGDFKAGLNEEVQKIKDGEYNLTIFNIQRFTSHHLSKVELPTPKKDAVVSK